MKPPLTEDLLRAYVDGALDGAEQARVAEAVAADAEARAFVEREQRLQAQLRAAFDPVLDEPVPDRLLQAVQPMQPHGEQRPELPAAPEAAPVGSSRRWAANVSWWAGMAASLLFGVLLGQRLTLPSEDATLMAAANGRMVARASLDEALTRRASGATAPADPVQIGWSYQARDGAYCRSFSLQREAMAGVACRDGEHWQVQMLAQQAPTAAGGYRQAGTTLPPAVLAAIDAQIDGAPLDAAAEADALRRGWRR